MTVDLAGLRARFSPCPESAEAPHCENLRAAAVLVLAIPAHGGPEIVLTRRSDTLPRHAGQVCLPGGRRQGEESLLFTALREAEEEIGVPPEAVEVLGALPARHLPSGWCVRPLLGVCEPRPLLRPCPREVVEIFAIPLQLVLDPGFYQRGSRMINNMKREFHYFDFEGHYVWGATAAILRSLAFSLS